MIAKYSNQVAKHFARRGSIDCEDIEIYAYGFELIIAMAIATSISLIMGLVQNQFWDVVILLSVFCSIRKHAGGFHADTHFNCLVTFQIVMFSMLWIVRETFEKLNFLNCVFILALCHVVLLCLAPVESIELPLTPEEHIHNKKQTFIVTLIYSCLLLAAYVYIGDDKRYVVTGIMAVVMATGVVIAGFVKNSLRKRR